MKQNTVTISVDKYNQLRDFKINTEAGKTYVVGFGRNHFIGNDRAVIEALELVTRAENKTIEIQNKYDTVKNQLDNYTSQVGFWEFVKLKYFK